MSLGSVTINIASIPGRGAQLYRTVRSLLPQCDRMNIMLNVDKYVGDGYTQLEYRYKALYDLFQDPRIHYEVCDNSLGDAAKFLNHPDKGWFLTCDDDIEYPPDYVEVMIAAAERYDRAAIISVHGRTLKPGKVKGYYWPEDRDIAHQCLMDMPHDRQVEFGGTGVMCYHCDTFYFDVSRVERKNMVDVWVGIQAHEEGIPIIGIAHKAGWLTYILPPDKPNIWKQSFMDAGLREYMAGVINKHMR